MKTFSLNCKIPGWGNYKPYQELLSFIGINDHIHLWNANLDQPASTIRSLDSLLSFEEKKRAQRFHFGKHRNRFIVCHGLLRILLSQYVGIEPQRIQIIQGKKGKPELSGSNKEKNIRFSLSYSINVGLIAVTQGREIGVDIEFKNRFYDYEEIIENFFSEKEKHLCHYQHERNKIDSFYLLWTKKEALVKAFGAGLIIPLSSFNVSLLDSEIVTLPAVEGFFDNKSRWQVNVIDFSTDFKACWAIEV